MNTFYHRMKHPLLNVLPLVVLLFSSFNSWSNPDYLNVQFGSKEVTFDRGTPVVSVIKAIETDFKVRFTYEAGLLKNLGLTKPFTVKESKLDEALLALFSEFKVECTKIGQKLYVLKGSPPAEMKNQTKPQGNEANTPKAEPIEVSGKVTDEANEPLIGVNIFEKSNPTNGVSSDFDGNFKIKVSDASAQLVFSYLGYETQEVKVAGRQNINVVLATNSALIQEVVVTALGVEKDEKLLTSNVQAIQSEDISRGRQESILSALEGKVSGVQISSTSGAPGASTEIILRGATSVDGDNQPLIVVDGIPISNASTSGTMNRASDINPNDIASVSVLKGASAAALYGIDAANGAIIITTKSGKKGKIQVGFNSYYGMSQVVNLHDQQDLYTTGYSGLYNGTTFSHWGPRYRKSDEVYNNVEDFFQTGTNFKTDLSLSGGTDNLTYYFSGSNLNEGGIVPNTDYTKRSLLMKVGSQLTDRLKMNATVNAIYVDNNYGIVGASGGWLSSVYRWPRWDNMAEYTNPDGSERNIWDPVSGDLSTVPDNPWWTAYHKVRNDEMNRVLGNIHLTYKLTDWLDLDYRIGRDFYNQHYKSVQEWGSSGSAYEGAISEFDRNSNKWTSTFLAKMDFTLADDFNFNVILGNNIQSDYAERTSVSGTQFKNPDLHSINNLKDIQNSQATGQRRVIGAFGDVKLDYKRMLILGVTMRNDWSSTLPLANRSFFYPSYSMGFIFSELMDPSSQDILSFGKIRLSYAEVGKDAPAHKLTQVLEQYLGIGGGWKNGAFAGNPALKPEITREFEAGIDLRFFKGRLGLDATYYQRVSDDQIITPRVTPVTGAILQTVNSGSVENKGVEVAINAKPIESDNFKWKITLNAFGNRSKLTKLFGDLVEFPVTYGQVSSIAIASSRLGEPLFSVIGTDYQRTDDGVVIVDEEGYPLIDNEKKYIGNREPDLWYGIVNTFDLFRDFEFSFQVDGAIGGDVLNATGASMLQSGLHTMVEEYRREEFVFDGVVENEDGSYSPNSTPVVLDRNFFTQNYGLVGSNFVETVNWLRLRNVGLTYFLPNHIISRLNISSLSFNVSAQNLFLMTDYSGGDPQVNNAGPNGGGASGAGTMGVDYYQVPARRSLSLGLNVKF
ncbi:SusC/RagA family TonB-linked outer membrane protein [Membranihabitans marinus]|uniref:SusC/RagA family TonB-linked outer membrane protein n=1 Tax=Membranihabitans marinus TaxID=1227546 RepID=UPI001F00EC0A|nr:SusC/RagA family TonB-linked outer membrane protein [Membranihabitans marinus]